MENEENKFAGSSNSRAVGMSYKFQRLREKLRQAITSGELKGKLPGERSLAKRFHVNAKTLSKALTDLAAEGLLDRSIGRGTYVKGSAPADSAQGRWLVLADVDDIDSSLVHALRTANSELQVVTTLSDLRPSFLNQFSAVIDTAVNTPEQFLRDLVVRSMPLVAVNREPRIYSMHSVLMDMTLGVSRLARDLMLSGHRRFAAVEPRHNSLIAHTLHQAAARYAPGSAIDSCSADEIAAAVENGASAIICGCSTNAQSVKANLDRAAINIPGQVSLTAVGCCEETTPCSGYFCTDRQMVEGVLELLKSAANAHPTVLWLAGAYQDRGTTGVGDAPDHASESAHTRVSGVAV